MRKAKKRGITSLLAQRHQLLFSLMLVVVASLLLSSSQKRGPRFDDMYDTYIITDAEASVYDNDDFDQIDYEELIAIISRGRQAYIAFEPAWQINLYDDDGVRYRLYISRSMHFFRVDSNYFRLSKRRAKRLKSLLLTLNY